jgi:hypothetical protein
MPNSFYFFSKVCKENYLIRTEYNIIYNIISSKVMNLSVSNLKMWKKVVQYGQKA